jgi:MFS family permease
MADSVSMRTTRELLIPLGSPAFRWLAAGYGASLVGSMFYFISLTWLTLSVSGSGLVLGSVLATAAIPRALFMIFGGAVADRFPPKAILIFTSGGDAVITTVLAALVFTGSVAVWHLYAVAALLGVVDPVAYPAANVLIPRIVEPAHLNSANSVFSLMTYVTTVVGPILSGLVVGYLGTGTALAASVFSACLSVAALVRIRTDPAPAQDGPARGCREFLADIRDGFSYAWHNRSVRAVIILLAAINLTLIGPVVIGGSIMADAHYSGARSFGLIISSWGLGGFVGALAAGVSAVRRAGAALIVASAVMGAGVLVFGLVPPLVVVLLVNFVTGVSNGWVEVIITTWLQIVSGEGMRGRVMGITAVAGIGLEPVSYALTGILARAGLRVIFFGAGITLLATTALTSVSRALREATVQR